jgi:hypothetical protein
MEYIILREVVPALLEKKVNEKLKEGFKCQGGVIRFVDIQEYYMQAMVKDK